MRPKKLTGFTQTTMLCAIVLLLAALPGIGYIPLGVTRATTIHLPVIVGSILLGPKKGAVIGFTFGLTSLITNTFMPTITSFVFSPFYGEGNIFSLVVCFVPRILTGVVPYYVYQWIKKFCKKPTVCLGVAGFAGSMTNTFLVMNLIFFCLAKAMAPPSKLPQGCTV